MTGWVQRTDQECKDMGCAVITRANRGIGLEFCRQLAARGGSVVAVCRKSSLALDALGVRVESGVDVTDDTTLAALVQRLAGEPVALLVNNAGIGEFSRLERIDFDSVRRQFEVNATSDD
ncbi:MAG: SDR family NAD(P)-dependent oxidoreductase [Hyphomonadaceae bacterium]|nr:SDR family NAD(P)-dependent oxidoreductase [Hyphomonadaceae bacterium]